MPDLIALRDPLDVPALGRWLGGALGFEGPLDVRQFAGGFSNVTVLATDAAGREAVVRLPPPGALVRGGHDVLREARLMRALAGHLPVPEVLAADSGGALGRAAVAMERVRGTLLRGATPADARPDAEAMARTADALVGTMARLHALDPAAIGLGDLGRPEGYVARTVGGWARRYADARTDDLPALERAFAWLAEHAPPEAAAALLHNDLKHDNLVLDALGGPGPARVRAVLDWELATVGCPLMDLGASLGYWAEPADPPALRAAMPSPTTWPGSPDRAGVLEAYARQTGRDVGDGVFYAVYGLARVAVIAQQIYRRHALGQTTDPRFGGLIHAVRACGDLAGRMVERGRVSDL